MRRLLSQHALSECPKRTQPCTYCSKEFVFDTIQVRWSPWGPSPCWLPAPADSLSASPEPPVPVSSVPRALPQPVWDTQHCPGGCDHPPQGELQHCHAAVPLQGSWLQAPGECCPCDQPALASLLSLPCHTCAPQHPHTTSALMSVPSLVLSPIHVAPQPHCCVCHPSPVSLCHPCVPMTSLCHPAPVSLCSNAISQVIPTVPSLLSHVPTLSLAPSC